MPPLSDFLIFPPPSLSARATRGFLERLLASTLRANERFISDLRLHARAMESASS
jgi:hypothetical protein